MSWRGKLLAASGDAKTVKGEGQGYLTAIMYLAPHTIATKKSLCPSSTPACRKACLYSAGRGSFNTVQSARMRKAQWFEHDRAGFMSALIKDIDAFQIYALRKGFVPCVRLNGTSDIQWENISPISDARLSHRNIMALFPNLRFYDYTKISKRLERAWKTVATDKPYLPRNYDLTFSQAENNAPACLDALEAGFRVATVFRTKAYPKQWLGRPVIDGDASDLRFLDPASCVVALSAKGAAKKDQTGFVREV